MPEFLRRLFLSDFMGHGYCYFWRPEIVWLHALSDSLIALSYYFIPLMLVYLVRKRRDLPFHWMFFMFGIFILGCGTTHAMELWTLWHGTYRLAGVIKAITAAASLATAVALVPMVPKAMLLPSPSQLQAANLELQKEIAERKRVEQALQEERNFIAAVLNTVGTLIIVIDPDGKVVQCNRACELLSGRTITEIQGQEIWNLFGVPEEAERFRDLIQPSAGSNWEPSTFEGHWSTETGETRLVAWAATALTDNAGRTRDIIVAGVDITEAKRLEQAVVDISFREQRRIGQDLHDVLGQHLTGVAFLCKVVEQKLANRRQPEAGETAQITQLVNEAIHKTRELSRGLLPVDADAQGLMSALEQRVGEVEKLFGVTCRFHCEEPVLIRDGSVATQLYLIAQEAVNNAVKHGDPGEIDISLTKAVSGITLRIEDDGVGLPQDSWRSRGMGLRIMNYRAKTIGASLRIERGHNGGTVITCHASTPAPAAQERLLVPSTPA
jgi:PAS domain S-box-containing protein